MEQRVKEVSEGWGGRVWPYMGGCPPAAWLLLHRCHLSHLLPRQPPTRITQVGYNYFRLHPKGVGLVCKRAGGLPPLTFVEEYLGEIHTPWRWFEIQVRRRRAALGEGWAEREGAPGPAPSRCPSPACSLPAAPHRLPTHALRTHCTTLRRTR